MHPRGMAAALPCAHIWGEHVIQVPRDDRCVVIVTM